MQVTKSQAKSWTAQKAGPHFRTQHNTTRSTAIMSKTVTNKRIPFFTFYPDTTDKSITFSKVQVCTTKQYALRGLSVGENFMKSQTRV